MLPVVVDMDTGTGVSTVANGTAQSVATPSSADTPAAAEGLLGGRLFLANEMNIEIKRGSRRIAAG